MPKVIIDVADDKMNLLLEVTELLEIEKTLVTLVTKIEFTPIKIIVYGLCGSILTGVIGALLTKILIK